MGERVTAAQCYQWFTATWGRMFDALPADTGGVLLAPAGVEPGSSIIPLQGRRATRRPRLIAALLATLSDRERRVLRLRFRLEDECPRSLAAIGRTLGLTRERIRQIEADGLRKLRDPCIYALLHDLLE
jgi:hypothetical protein